MNTWNSEFVRSGFNNHALGFITDIDGEVELQHPMVASAYRAIVAQRQDAPNPQQTLQKAREYYRANKDSIKFPYKEPTLGYVVKWLSELGKTVELHGLLESIDKNLQPTWENGGLYYPRNDQQTDLEGRWMHMDPFTGNAAIGYARLNVENGQKKIWDSPWTKEDLASRPWVDGIDYSQGVNCLRGVWDGTASAMIITLEEWAAKGMKVAFDVKNLPEDRWVVYERHGLVLSRRLVEGVSVHVEADIGPGEEVDFVIVKEASSFL